MSIRFYDGISINTVLKYENEEFAHSMFVSWPGKPFIPWKRLVQKNKEIYFKKQKYIFTMI